MRFSSALSIDADLEAACREAVSECMAALHDESPAAAVDLCVAFASPRYGSLDAVPELLSELTGARRVLGCSGGGIIGNGLEIEGQAAFSVTVARLPGVDLELTHVSDVDLPDPDASPSAWTELCRAAPDEARGLIVLPEPFSFPAGRLLEGLDYAYPAAPTVGGVASGGDQPGHNALFVGRECRDSGAVVLALTGAIEVDTAVAQGCKPFGAVGTITACREHYLMTIDGKPTLEFLQEQVRGLEGETRELAQRSPMFLGIGMDPFRFDNPDAGDFLIRNIMGYDRQTGMMTIGEQLANGRKVQFHLRDARTSAEDLRCVLGGLRAKSPPQGALLFSCLGRGTHLYGEAGHDSRMFHEIIGNTPLAGFFCNGEIGPVAGTTHLHGYTSAFALFAEATS